MATMIFELESVYEQPLETGEYSNFSFREQGAKTPPPPHTHTQTHWQGAGS